MPAAARVGDHHTCPKCEPGPVPHVGGAILPSGCASVLIHGAPAARVGDRSTCVGPPDTIVMGEPSVLIGDQPAARVGDPTSHGGVIVAGCGCVQIGQTAQSIVMREAAKSGAAFCEECARKKAAAEKAKRKKGTKGAAPAATTATTHAPTAGGAGPRRPAGTRSDPPRQVPPSRDRTPRADGRAMDVERAVAYANEATGGRTHGTGWCGRYVVNAINAAGGHVNFADARNLGPNLLGGGFRDVGGRAEYDGGSYHPERGDVVVFDRVPGHKNGHTAIWNGSRWVSDFDQADLIVNDAYRGGNFRVFRP